MLAGKKVWVLSTGYPVMVARRDRGGDASGIVGGAHVVADLAVHDFSILDYVFRELAVSYLDRTDLAHVKPAGASFDELGGGEEG